MRSKIYSLIGLILIFGLVAMVILSLNAGNKKEPITLTYAEVNSLDGSIVGEMAKAFKEKVEELSGGEILIDIQAGGVLGSEDQILDNLLGGGNITDISRVSAMALTQYGCEKASLLAIPYTFVSEDHFWNFVSSDLADEILMEPHEIGLPLRGLCYGEEGFRHFFFKNEVKFKNDLLNLKIRVSSDPIMTGMVKDLGAFPTSVSFTELYSALSTGVVDGAEQPTANYRSNAFHEVAPYLLLDGHTLGAVQIVIADYSWEKLNDQQREWLMEAADYASKTCRDKVSEIEQKTFEQLKADGVTIIPVEDKSEWVEACNETIKKNSEKNAGLYQKIVDMQYKNNE